MESLVVTDLSLAYGVDPIVQEISFEVPWGEVCALAGSSGSGKSTLLKAVAGLLPPRSGSIRLFGSNPDPKRLRLAFVPQNFALLAWKRVGENILLPARLGHHMVDAVRYEEIVSVLGLKPFLHSYPHLLSGGERQRVALARAFVMKPDLLLLDEPFSALDMATAERSYALLQRLLEDFPTTTLLVTHNPREAVLLAHHVLLLGGKPGHLVANLTNPTEEDVRRLLVQLS